MPLMQGLVLHLDKLFWEKTNINNSSPHPNLIYSKLNSYKVFKHEVTHPKKNCH